MKSPWKFIGNLISRGRSADPENGRNSDDADATARPDQVPQSTLRVPPAAKASLEPPADDAALPADEAQTPERSIQVRSNASATSKRNKAVKERATRTKRVGRAKKTSADTVAQKVATPNNQAGNAANRQDAFQTDVEDVDAEVRRLRRQLADALIVQNAQLKKMLERFGVS
jgi:hypothetical protein